MSKLTKKEEVYLRAFGQHVDRLIKKRGYKSAYDFWVNRAGDHISRAALNYILAGKNEAKLLTLRTLANLLDIDSKDLLDFRA